MLRAQTYNYYCNINNLTLPLHATDLLESKPRTNTDHQPLKSYFSFVLHTHGFIELYICVIAYLMSTDNVYILLVY